MKTRLIIPLLFLIFSTSCDNWLDVSPKADVKAEDFYSRQSGYNDGLIGIYSLMSTSSSYGRDLSFGFIDVLAQYYDNLDGLYNYGSFRYASKYNWSATTEKNRVSAIWNRAYKAISNINLALSFIDKNKSSFDNESIYKVYKGELLGLRAFLHFDMLRLFGPSPTNSLYGETNNLNQKAIPYVSLFTSEAQEQLTTKDVIDKIVEDLLQAKELMRDNDPYGENTSLSSNITDVLTNRFYRMNYFAVTGLLSRVYLYVGMKDKALEQAIELTGSVDGTKIMPSQFSLAVSPASTKDQLFEKELIFSLSKVDLKDATKRYFFNEDNDYYRQYVLSMTITRKNKAFNTSDLSTPFRNTWLKLTSSNSSYSLSKYQEQNKIPLIRLSEMFLIAAECSDNSDEALWYLNQLRAHRGLVLVTDSKDLLNEIYKEYRREFIGEGQLFYFYKRNYYETIGSGDDVVIDRNQAYNIPLPDSEIEFGKYF